MVFQRKTACMAAKEAAPLPAVGKTHCARMAAVGFGEECTRTAVIDDCQSTSHRSSPSRNARICSAGTAGSSAPLSTSTGVFDRLGHHWRPECPGCREKDATRQSRLPERCQLQYQLRRQSKAHSAHFPSYPTQARSLALNTSSAALTRFAHPAGRFPSVRMSLLPWPQIRIAQPQPIAIHVATEHHIVRTTRAVRPFSNEFSVMPIASSAHQTIRVALSSNDPS